MWKTVVDDEPPDCTKRQLNEEWDKNRQYISFAPSHWCFFSPCGLIKCLLSRRVPGLGCCDENRPWSVGMPAPFQLIISWHRGVLTLIRTINSVKLWLKALHACLGPWDDLVSLTALQRTYITAAAHFPCIISQLRWKINLFPMWH